VEVQDPTRLINVRHTSRLKVLPKHFRRSVCQPAIRAAERLACGQPGTQVVLEGISKVLTERDSIGLAVFGVPRWHDNDKPLEIEVSCRQTPRFVCPQACFRTEPIEQAPLRPAHTKKLLAASSGHNQLSQFLVSSRPALPSHVSSLVQLHQSAQRVFAGLSRVYHPSAEALQGYQVP
jgi:hypothetical protein